VGNREIGEWGEIVVIACFVLSILSCSSSEASGEAGIRIGEAFKRRARRGEVYFDLSFLRELHLPNQRGRKLNPKPRVDHDTSWKLMHDLLKIKGAVLFIIFWASLSCEIYSTKAWN
jgi:hypothetical protein